MNENNQEQSLQLNPATTTLVTLCGNSKQDREAFAQSIVDQLKDGTYDPLRMHIMVKNTEALLDVIKDNKEYKELCLTEAGKYGKKFEKENAAFEIKEVGVKFDYTNCNDAEYTKLMAEKAALDKKIKTREAYLKALPPGGHEIRVDDELITILPPIKTSTTAITVSLK